MTNIEKYCEECGAINEQEVKYCKECGAQFFEVIKEQKEFSSKYLSDENISQSKRYSSLDQFQSPQQTGHQPIMMVAPRQWRGGNLGKAIKLFYTSPVNSTGELLEDPNAPSPILLVLIMALISGFFAYLSALKTTYVEVNVDPRYADNFTAETVSKTAIQNGITAFVIIFLFWWVGSWILGLLIKGGLPPNSIVKYNASQSMRKLNAYRYLPTILSQLIIIILLSKEKNREFKVTMQDTFLGIKAPIPEPISNYSNFYLYSVLAISLITSVITSYYLYKSIKFGLHHQGSAPLIIAILLVIIPFVF